MPKTAAIDFKYTLDHCRENSPNKAYHLIQAFAPGEVGYEEAHRIGHLSDNLCKEHNLSVIIPSGERGKKIKGYEIKGETFGEDAVKYISFRPLDKERFVRGSTRSLGKAPVSVNVFYK